MDRGAPAVPRGAHPLGAEGRGYDAAAGGPAKLRGEVLAARARAPAWYGLRVRDLHRRAVRWRADAVVHPARAVPNRLRRLLDRRGTGGPRVRARGRRPVP